VQGEESINTVVLIFFPVRKIFSRPNLLPGTQISTLSLIFQIWKEIRHLKNYSKKKKGMDRGIERKIQV
jgi:hypothetical protein